MVVIYGLKLTFSGRGLVHLREGTWGCVVQFQYITKQRKRPLRVVDDSNVGAAKYFDYLFYFGFEASIADPRAQNALGHLQRVPGAYSEAAALKAYPQCEAVHCDQFEAVFQAVELWLVLPIENSLGGSIHRNYDLLLRHHLHPQHVSINQRYEEQ